MNADRKQAEEIKTLFLINGILYEKCNDYNPMTEKCSKYCDYKKCGELCPVRYELPYLKKSSIQLSSPLPEITEKEIKSIAELDSTYEPEMAAFIRGFNACLSRLSERKEQKTTEEDEEDEVPGINYPLPYPSFNPKIM
jgi:hypothetical protein